MRAIDTPAGAVRTARGASNVPQELADPAGLVRPTEQPAATGARVRQLLESVMDPELPQLSIVDLGMIRSVDALEGGAVRVGVSPTYSGCPAVRVIHELIRRALQAGGIQHVDIREVLTPAWTSEWITERGRAILCESGIAPPSRAVAHPTWRARDPRALAERSSPICCPRCRSTRTERISEFGSTPCKAQYRCLECLEPFEYFKCI